jgi:hypothetical protein
VCHSNHGIKRPTDAYLGYPHVVLKLYLAAPAIRNHYKVETSLCQHFAEALTA